MVLQGDVLMLIIKLEMDSDRFVGDNRPGENRMNKLNQLKNRRSGFLLVLVLGFIVIPVIAQLLSNNYSRVITVHSLDESFRISSTAEFTNDTWVGIEITSSIYIEKIKPSSGTIHIRINHTESLAIDTSMFALGRGYRTADNSPYSNTVPVTLVQVDSDCVEYSESVWFDTGESESYYTLALTFNLNAIGGEYDINVFIDS